MPVCAVHMFRAQKGTFVSYFSVSFCVGVDVVVISVVVVVCKVDIAVSLMVAGDGWYCVVHARSR